jgi:sirohydrochlorin ferrochelatase
MSDLDVLRAIEEMERRLRAGHRNMDPHSVQEWQIRFQAAVASAERGSSWARIVQKAQVVQGILEQRLIQIVVDKEAAKYERADQPSRSPRVKSNRVGRS